MGAMEGSNIERNNIERNNIERNALYEQIKAAIVVRTEQTDKLQDEEIKEFIDEELCAISQKSQLSIEIRKELETDIFNGLRRLDVVQDLMEDEEVTEIMINGFEHIFYEKKGKLHLYHKQFHSKERYLDMIWKIAGDNNRMVNEAMPIMDTTLTDGSRVNIIMNPIAIEGPVMCIRKFQNHRMNLEELIRLNSLDRELADFLILLVQHRYNLFIYGGTGSGKTVLLNALSEYIPEDERIITIEDAAELDLKQVDNLVRLQVRTSTLEGNNEVTVRSLLKASLRLRPDRIILGEVRGGECVDLLQVLNTGHAGSFSTGHGNSCNEMIDRIATMVLMGIDMPLQAVLHQIVSGIDIMVQVGRCKDGTRKILSVDEVIGVEGNQVKTSTLVQYQKEGSWQFLNPLQKKKKLEQYGK